MPKKFFVFLMSLFLTFGIINSANAMWRGRGRMIDVIKGNGNVVTEKRELIEGVPYSVKINQVSFISSPEVQVHAFPGDHSVISITTDENILALLDIRVNEDTSEIEILSPERISPTEFFIEITSPLRAFIGSGEFDFDVTSIRLPTFNLAIDGRSSGKINLGEIDRTSINICGETKLKLAGATNNFNLKVDGQCKVDAIELICHNCKIHGDGMGKVNVFADTSLTLKGSGDWQCTYKGPGRINKSVDGICKIRKID